MHYFSILFNQRRTLLRKDGRGLRRRPLAKSSMQGLDSSLRGESSARNNFNYISLIFSKVKVVFECHNTDEKCKQFLSHSFTILDRDYSERIVTV